MNRLSILLLTMCLSLLGCSDGIGGGKGSAELRLHSFDGGGPRYSMEIEDKDLVSVTKSVRYDKKDHAQLDGAGYDVIFTFTGQRPGRTAMTLQERSPIAGNFDHLYDIVVGEDLAVTLTELSVVDLDALTAPAATLVIETEHRLLYAAFEDNPSAAAFRDRLSEGPVAVELHDYGHFEKVGPLPWALVQSDEDITAAAGDVILYEGDKITIYYDENSWHFTRLAKIENVTREELLEALGEGSVTATFYLEWSE